MQTVSRCPQSSLRTAIRRPGAASSRRVTVRAVSPTEQFSLKDGRKVEIYASPADVSKAVCGHFIEAYKAEVKAKGSLVIAIPSGSVVTAIGTLKGNPDIDFSKVGRGVGDW